jgi:AMMECR1 domain-containing protein
MRFKHYFLLVILISWAAQALAEGPLDNYRRYLGSSFERGVIRYTRACILHELDPDIPIPPLQLELPSTGLYLTLMRNRQVRACIGTFSPRASDMRTAIRKLTEEIVYSDLRSQPLSLMEMEDLSVVLSFVGDLKVIRDPYGIDFTAEGLYVSQNGRAGVLLPGESKTMEYGLNKIKKQIRFDSDQPARYAAFEVVVFDERRLQ